VTFLIVGASAGLGRALAEECARRGHDVVLLASDERDLIALAAHLRIVHGVTAEYVACRIDSNDDEVWAALESVRASMDGLMFPIGLASDEDTGLLAPREARRLIDANFVGPASLISRFWPELLERPRAYVVGFGSVAAIRGRRRNVVYAAAKRGLLSYFESLRHLAVGSPVRVHFYTLGYLDTQQTFGKPLPFPKARPEQVARFVLDRLDRDEAATVYPRFWSAIGMVLRAIPWSIYKRLNF
jgi:short-subunit dehydrogenase